MWTTVERAGHLDVGMDEAVTELRLEILQFVVGAVTIAHLTWHVLVTAFWPFQLGYAALAIFPVVVAGEIAVSHLASHGDPRSIPLFLGWSMATIGLAALVFGSGDVFLLCTPVALAAVVIVHPIAGLAVVAATPVMMALVHLIAPAGPIDLRQVAVASSAALLACLATWAVARSLVTAVQWSLHSYDQARRNMEDAREHRARLVQALRQLDVAYYQLERANAALELAWRASDEAERAKSDLVTHISHELRTPLNLIIGFSEMMVAYPENYGGVALPAVYRGDVNAIFRSAQHLLALADDILDLARVGAARLPLSLESADLSEIVRDAVDLIQGYVSAKGLNLRVDSPDHLPPVYCDRLRVRQVLLNLLTNAARFTDHGEISVTVTRRQSDLLAEVADTGRGIPAAELDRIFEEFQHVEQVEPGWHAGSGLGLPISKKLVELHGGSMWVESTLAKGTKFYFALPFEAVSEAPVEPGERRIGPPRWSAHQQALVVVGADAAMTRLLQRYVAGYRVVTAADFPEALELAGDLRARAVVTDVSMQRGDERVSCPVPLIRLPLPRDRRLLQGLHAVEYLVKPISRKDLLRAVDRLAAPVRQVLVVDDDPRAVRLLTRMLQSRGDQCQITAAHNGLEALEAMRSARPDLVLLDMVMPQLGGEEVLRRMAEDDRTIGIPVIVVSARAEQEGEIAVEGDVVVSRGSRYRLAELVDLMQAILGSLGPTTVHLATSAPGRAADSAP